MHPLVVKRATVKSSLGPRISKHSNSVILLEVGTNYEIKLAADVIHSRIIEGKKLVRCISCGTKIEKNMEFTVFAFLYGKDECEFIGCTCCELCYCRLIAFRRVNLI